MKKVLLVEKLGFSHLFRQVGDELAARHVPAVTLTDGVTMLKEIEQHQDAAALLTMHDFPLTRDFLRTMPNLTGALSFVTGTEGFDEQAATELGVVIANGQIPENYNSMAEATIMLILAGLYDLSGSVELLKTNTPNRPEYRATMMMGKTIGIVGFGKIARAVVDRLAGWNVNIQVYTPRVRPPIPNSVKILGLDDLLRSSDVICLLANLNPETHHLLSQSKLRLIKKGAVLVNTARGGLIDERALFRAAREGRFKALALDTFETEPLPMHSPLRDLDNAILTPHCVGHTVETHAALVRVAADNLERLSRGKLPTNIRNPLVEPLWVRRWTTRP